MYKLLNGDCLELLKDIPNNSIDLIVTDCPYKIVGGGCTTGIYGNKSIEESDVIKTRLGYKHKNGHVSLFGCLNDMAEDVKKGKMFKHNDISFKEWLPEIYRVLKENTHCYIMVNARNFKELQQEAENVGFKYQNLLVWNKNNATPNKYYMNQHELILMLRKGKAKNINNMGTKNILVVPNIIGNKKHPTEKPVDLMKILIENSSNENDLVLDPFMGSGSTGIACKESNRKFIGMELDEKYFNIAKSRIDNTLNNKECVF